jgi:UDP-2-acetamido-3-amino-2,3-dideoxy-glucuronate N-acetyltransferase
MQNNFVHTSAIVDEGAIIGEGTHVWHFSHIMAKAIVGKNCNIGQNCVIDNNAVIGDRVKIQNNVSVYNAVTIEDDVFIGPSVVFTNVINPRSFIERKAEFRNTLIKKGTTIGANATIICGNTIGKYALIGAGAVVTNHVLNYEVVTGNPVIHAGWVSKSGEKLVFQKDGKATCPLTREVYKLEGNVATCV